MKSALPLAMMLAVSSLMGSSGPDDRQVTDPKSIESQTNPQARPIPVDELYFTRSVNDPAWSPDGREIVFTTNLTGRNNLWKVSAAGGWPLRSGRPRVL